MSARLSKQGLDASGGPAVGFAVDRRAFDAKGRGMWAAIAAMPGGTRP